MMTLKNTSEQPFIEEEELSTIKTELSHLLTVGSIVGIYIVTIVGLIGQWRMPDDPSYRSRYTDLLNPWATWCQWTDNGHLGSCYGTSWNHWGGPYSIMWYWANALLSLNGSLNYTLVLFIINCAIQVRLGFSWIAIPWSVNVLFCLLSWPQNMIVLWFCLLAVYRWQGLILAPAFKLPVGAFLPQNVAVWNIAFNSQTAVRDPGNWFTYLWLAVFWVIAFYLQFRRRHRKGSESDVC